MTAAQDRAEVDMSRDRAAEAWLAARHASDWYLGEASASEWEAAYDAVDAVVCTGADDCSARLHVHGCYADRGACDAPSEHSR